MKSQTLKDGYLIYIPTKVRFCSLIKYVKIMENSGVK